MVVGGEDFWSKRCGRYGYRNLDAGEFLYYFGRQMWDPHWEIEQEWEASSASLVEKKHWSTTSKETSLTSLWLQKCNEVQQSARICRVDIETQRLAY